MRRRVVPAVLAGVLAVLGGSAAFGCAPPEPRYGGPLGPSPAIALSSAEARPGERVSGTLADFGDPAFGWQPIELRLAPGDGRLLWQGAATSAGTATFSFVTPDLPAQAAGLSATQRGSDGRPWPNTPANAPFRILAGAPPPTTIPPPAPVVAPAVVAPAAVAPAVVAPVVVAPAAVAPAAPSPPATVTAPAAPAARPAVPGTVPPAPADADPAPPVVPDAGPVATAPPPHLVAAASAAPPGDAGGDEGPGRPAGVLVTAAATAVAAAAAALTVRRRRSR